MKGSPKGSQARSLAGVRPTMAADAGSGQSKQGRPEQGAGNVVRGRPAVRARAYGGWLMGDELVPDVKTLEELVRSVPLFQLVGASQMPHILRLLRPETLKPGQVLFRQGDPGNAMW